jgi:hypothetical protein
MKADEPVVYDRTQTNCDGVRQFTTEKPPEPVIEEMEVGHLVAKVGTLEIDLSLFGVGTILRDGQPFPVKRMVIEIEVGQPIRVTASFYPSSPSDTVM